MHFGALIFFTDYSIGPVELARALEQRGFEVPVGRGALSHPAVAHVALSAGRRAAEEVLRRHGPVRDPGRGRGGDDPSQARHRHLPRHPARHHPDRQAGGEPRPDLERPLPVRHRRRLECGGDGRPRHRLQGAVRGDARARRGHARDLDQVEARVRGSLREVRTHDDVAEAGAEAASRRSSSAAPFPMARGARSPTAMAGCPTRAGPPTATCSTCCPRSTRC